MHKNVSIRTFEDLLNAGMDCITGVISYDFLKFEGDLVLNVRIKGEKWDETIDYRGARYIIELQNAVDRLMAHAADPDESLKDIKKYITVRVRVTKGSANYEIIIKETLGKMVEKVGGKGAVLLISLAILVTGGYFYLGSVLEYKKSIAADQSKAETLDKILPVLDKTLDIIQKAELEKPSRIIVSRLNDEDTITFHNQKEITADQAKKRYPKKPKIRTEQGLFDGTYKIISIGFDKLPPEFTLESDGFQFKAKAELSEQDIDNLANDFKACLKSGDDFNVNLQVFIVYNKRELKTASITAIGEKRSGSKNLSDQIKIWKS